MGIYIRKEDNVNCQISNGIRKGVICRLRERVPGMILVRIIDDHLEIRIVCNENGIDYEWIDELDIWYAVCRDTEYCANVCRRFMKAYDSYIRENVLSKYYK